MTDLTIQELTKNKKANEKLLIEYGFKKVDDVYYLSKPLMDNQFLLKISISKDGNITTDLTEVELNEPFTLYKTNPNGAFTSKIRNLIVDEVDKIINTCYENSFFKCDQVNVLVDYIKAKYDVEPEYLFKKFPSYAVFRRKDNNKWFAILMTIGADKLNLKTKDEIEVVNLRIKDEDMSELLKQENFFPGWHMNKKYWYTVVLNNSLPNEILFEKIDDSFLSND